MHLEIFLLNNLFQKAINAVHSHQQFYLAYLHSFDFYHGNTVKSPAVFAGFGSVAHELRDAGAQGTGPHPHPGERNQQVSLMMRP